MAGGVVEDDDRGELCRWEIKTGLLKVLNAAGDLAFECAVVPMVGSKLILRGNRPGDTDPSSTLREPRSLGRFSQTRDGLARQIEVHSWSVGEHSYGLPDIIEAGLARLVIGIYCSIAGGMKIALGDGAVLGAKTIVTSDVPSYAVMVATLDGSFATSSSLTSWLSFKASLGGIFRTRLWTA